MEGFIIKYTYTICMVTKPIPKTKVVRKFADEEEEDFLIFMHNELFEKIFSRYNLCGYSYQKKQLLVHYNKLKFLRNYYSNSAYEIIAVLMKRAVKEKHNLTIAEFIRYIKEIQSDAKNDMHSKANLLKRDKFIYETIQLFSYLEFIQLEKVIGGVEKKICITEFLFGEDVNKQIAYHEERIKVLVGFYIEYFESKIIPELASRYHEVPLEEVEAWKTKFEDEN